MSIAYSLLLVCIIFASGSAVHDGSAARSLVATLAAIALACVAVSARAADVQFAARVTRGLKLAAAVPALWIAIQLLPTPFGAHSVWNYANEALGRHAWGHVSVDLGATILALASYAANIALITVGVFVARDRRRAELILFVVIGVTAITTLVLLVARWGLVPINAATANDGLAATSALGIILSLANVVRAIERRETRNADKPGPEQNILAALIASGAVLLLSISGLASSATVNVALVAAFGLVSFGSLRLIRRIGLGSWATGTLAATMIVAAAMIIFWRYDPASPLSPFLQFAEEPSAQAFAATQRLISDAGWSGTGAGTYAAIFPVYQDLGSSLKAPSSAAVFAIELGWPMVVFAMALTIWLIVTLYRGALARGRDSFYPAAAAACTVVVLGEALCNASLLNSSIAVVGDAIIGLGLAQSVSGRDVP